MMEIIIGIIIAVVMIVACVFVNDTKKKHGVCCGRMCGGCPNAKSLAADDKDKKSE